MKITIFPTLAVIALLAGGRGLAQDKKSTGSETSGAPSEQLEAKLKATLSGHWCSIKEGTLSAEKEDKYTIIGITKVGGDKWIINARIQYNKRDIVAPIPVQVKWASDTPVLIVDNLPVPGGGVYSARVLIYGHTYAGSWSGGDHAGLLNGIIANESEDKVSEPK